MATRKLELTDQVFGRLTVTGIHSKHKCGHYKWSCVCVCGKECIAIGSELKRGNIASCGCLVSLGNGRIRSYEALYNKFCSASKLRGITVELSYEDFIEFTKIPNCHYCNSEIVWSEFGTKKGHGYNLDRKDSTKGYTSCNCVVCCFACNRGKSDKHSYEEWKEISGLINAMRAGRDYAYIYRS